MDGATWGWIGGIAGGLIGVMGGLFGTWMSLRAAKSPAERAILWRFVIACWVGVALFCVLAFVLPSPWNVLLWIPYLVLLAVGIAWCNAALRRVRSQP
jgi:hypothetical protein